ncbi:MAG: cyclic nucleotide-binding and patatin-like phospholipase domain-containing protein [Hyphomicrobiaceae bacterium]
MPSEHVRLSTVAAFKGLNEADLARLEALLSPIPVTRGTALVREGEAADALYVVVTGRFSVDVAGHEEPVAEISSGDTIGEIAFFAGGLRTATCRAIRDSVVVSLSRADFDALCALTPAIWSNITATLANRLAAETRKSARLRGARTAKPPPRTIAIVGAGHRPVPQEFIADLCAHAQRDPATLVISSRTLHSHGLALSTIEDVEAAHRLNELESRYERVVYVADETLTPWSEKAIRQADEVVLVGYQGSSPIGAPVARNALEEFSLALDLPPRHRLAILHDHAHGVQGTRHWLAQRPVSMHHHAAMGDADSLARLWRFVMGRAMGLVACGGGAYCAAHIGLYKALSEAQIALDLVGGASGGAAMAAAFAEDKAADEIDRRVHRMFIEGKAMQRYTLPRYSLLDHTHFDRLLQEQYGHTRIEDLWKPYFAVALDLTNYRLEVLRTGPVWAAIRASAAIPAVLPPYFASDGNMFVDGSVASNVPIDVMRQIKRGPNIVVTFDPPTAEKLNANYADLPGRRELFWKLLLPWTRAELPDVPSPASVLVRTLMANRNHFERHLQPDDWLLMPPTPPHMGALDWRQHSALVEAAYVYAKKEIADRRASQTLPV